MYGQVKKDVREIIQTLCEYKKVNITAGAVCIDHVHLCIELPPEYSVSSFMGYLKGKSALMIFDRHPEFKTRGDKEFWARGYYVETIGNIDEAIVKKYIEKQMEESKKGND
jgi:putative transposase